jgi:hypothetical protein
MLYKLFNAGEGQMVFFDAVLEKEPILFFWRETSYSPATLIVDQPTNDN